MGAQFSTVPYNALALSTLLYVAQLEDPPGCALSAESAGLRAILPGPGHWISKNDAFFF